MAKNYEFLSPILNFLLSRSYIMAELMVLVGKIEQLIKKLIFQFVDLDFIAKNNSF